MILIIISALISSAVMILLMPINIKKLNKIAIDKELNKISEKFESFGFETISIDGNNIAQIIEAFEKAKQIKGKPTMIVANTIKGKGVSFMENEARMARKSTE